MLVLLVSVCISSIVQFFCFLIHLKKLNTSRISAIFFCISPDQHVLFILETTTIAYHIGFYSVLYQSLAKYYQPVAHHPSIRSPGNIESLVMCLSHIHVSTHPKTSLGKQTLSETSPRSPCSHCGFSKVYPNRVVSKNILLEIQ